MIFHPFDRISFFLRSPQRYCSGYEGREKCIGKSRADPGGDPATAAEQGGYFDTPRRYASLPTQNHRRSRRIRKIILKKKNTLEYLVSMTKDSNSTTSLKPKDVQIIRISSDLIRIQAK